MRDARVEEVDHMSDSDSEEREGEGQALELTVGIFPTHQGPTYLLFPSKQEKDNWLYHLTVVSGGGPSAGTQYEQLVQKLMETDGDPSMIIFCGLRWWKNLLIKFLFYRLRTLEASTTFTFEGKYCISIDVTEF